MKKTFVRELALFGAGGGILLGLSSCTLPKVGEMEAESGLSATNMAGLAPEMEASPAPVTVPDGGGDSESVELPEAILAAGPAYEGERVSPWDMPADEFVNLVSRSESQAGDESLLNVGDYLAYAASVMTEQKAVGEDLLPAMPEAAEGTEEPAGGELEIEVLDVISAETAGDETAGLASVADPLAEAVMAMADDTATHLAGGSEMDVEPEEMAEAGEVMPVDLTEMLPREEPEPSGAVTSQGNFTIAGSLEIDENDETLNLPRLPVKAHERFRTVLTRAQFVGGGNEDDGERRNALGSGLQTGGVRSAAADWSVYPVGTRFRIVGDASATEYVVDDFQGPEADSGSIDLMMADRLETEQWGARRTVIEVLNMGSFEKSVAVMKSSEARLQEAHVMGMVNRIENRLLKMNKAERGVRPEGGLLGRIGSRNSGR